jgi:hypothetical protein
LAGEPITGKSIENHPLRDPDPVRFAIVQDEQGCFQPQEIQA